MALTYGRCRLSFKAHECEPWETLESCAKCNVSVVGADVGKPIKSPIVCEACAHRSALKFITSGGADPEKVVDPEPVEADLMG